MEDGTLAVPMIYGNALISIILGSPLGPSRERHGSWFTMKHVLMRVTQGREKNILNQEWGNVILKID